MDAAGPSSSAVTSGGGLAGLAATAFNGSTVNALLAAANRHHHMVDNYKNVEDLIMLASNDIQIMKNNTERLRQTRAAYANITAPRQVQQEMHFLEQLSKEQSARLAERMKQVNVALTRFQNSPQAANPLLFKRADELRQHLYNELEEYRTVIQRQQQQQQQQANTRTVPTPPHPTSHLATSRDRVGVVSSTTGEF